MSVAGVLAGVVVLGAAVMPGATNAEPSQAEGGRTWVAIGDSISSGYGIPAVSGEASAWGAQCARADGAAGDEAAMTVVAAAQLAAKGHGHRHVLTACAGAVTDDWAVEIAEAYSRLGTAVNTPVERGVPTRDAALVQELDGIAASGNRFDVLSMTFGANNVGLGMLGELCMDTRAADGAPMAWDSLGWESCDISKEQADSVLGALTRGGGQMPGGTVPLWSADPRSGETEPVLAAVGRYVKPGGRVLVMGYPQIVPDPSRTVLGQRWGKIPGLHEEVGSCQGLSEESMMRVREVIGSLNAGIEKATAAANAAWSPKGVTFTYVDMNSDLGFEKEQAAHGICTPEPWINDAFTQNGPLHPNATGHAKAGEALAKLMAAG